MTTRQDPPPSLAIQVGPPSRDQDPARTSFVGGCPQLPASLPLPTCLVCGAVETFFFQVGFPARQPWAGQSLAVFQCTACHDEEHPTPFIDRKLIPTMRRPDLRPGDDIPDGALNLVQRTFRFLSFTTAEATPRADHPVRVVHRPIDLVPQKSPKRKAASKVGGWPGWLDENQTPGKYQGEPFVFLMQWQSPRSGFERVPGSPAAYHPMAKILPELATRNDPYVLFTGVQLYFFGNRAGGRPNLHMVTEVP